MAKSSLVQAWAAYKNEDYATARELFAKDGSNEALFNLGQMKRNGEGAQANPEAARQLFEQCGDDAYALTALGEMWQSGELGQPDFVKARELFSRAVELGDTAAMCMLGSAFAGGEGGEIDLAVPVKICRQGITSCREFAFNQQKEAEDELDACHEQAKD